MDLRPLSLGELLDRTFTLYRRHFRLFVGIMAVPSTIAMLLAVLIAVFQRAAQKVALDKADPAVIPAEVFMMVGMFAGTMVLMVAYLVVYAVALGATSFAVSELYLGRSATIAEVYGRMRGRVGRLVWLMFNLLLRVGGVGFAGIMLAAIAGGIIGFLTSPVLLVVVMLIGWLATGALCVYMMLRYGVAVPALILESLTARQAIARSIELTRGNLGRVFLLGLCATVIAYAGIALFQGPFMIGMFMAGPETTTGFWLNIASAVSGTIGGTFTGPIMIIGLALMYYDTRIRKEGLDLDLMIDALDKRGPGAEPAGA